jgi:hypothetical protein
MTKYLGIAMVLVLGLFASCSDDGGTDQDTTDGDADGDTDGSSCSSDDPAPIIAFVRPTDGAEVTGAQTVEISVTDRCGIREVTLAVDGATTATWTEEPYTLAWDTSGLVSGNHTLRASATDTAGQTASATIEVDVHAECLTPTDCPPRVRIVYPTADSHVCGVLNIEATATGEGDVAEVEFQADDVLLGTDSTAPYQVEWITTSLADGNHTLTATARDASGQEAWHTVSVIVENAGGACDNLPTAVITEPADGSYVYGDITVRVNASDDIGVIRVRVFVDAGMIWEDVTTPFEGVWHTADFTEGPHLIRAEATDTADQQSAETSLEVDVDRTPPTITITAPSDGEMVSGTRVVTANATDNLSVASVVFTATGGLSRSFTDSEAPFEWPLDFPEAAECDTNVAIEAEATDRAGWTAADSISVVLVIPAESCNGRDDDCDGSTDETFTCIRDITETRTCTCGGAESRTCLDSCAWGGWTGCSGGTCIPDTARSCTASCGSGTETCSATCTWGPCVPPAEDCNGVDDDCDTVVDEGACTCIPSADTCERDAGDGNPCNGTLHCTATFPHACEMDMITVPPEGTTCDDGLFCNGADTCSGGDPATRSCSAHAGDPCDLACQTCSEEFGGVCNICTTGETCDVRGCGLSTTGTCVTDPRGMCPDIWAPECGCDGLTYSSACWRISDGVALDYVGECAMP